MRAGLRMTAAEIAEILRIEVMTSYPTAKWALDKATSVALLVLLSPVFAFLFVLMGLEMLVRPGDRGPWLYREERISRGCAFELLKFRTLRLDVLARIDSESHARMHEGDEGNLTWAGRRLLKPWYLDELPQLWNVLRGDMSLVGPRPWPSSMVTTQVAEGLSYRNEVAAGWTGPAQVEKGVTKPTGYAVLDLAYVELCRTSSGWTVVRTDLTILRRTVIVMAKGEGLQF